MRNEFSIYRNWRAYPLMLLAVFSFLLLCGEAEDFKVFLLSKLAGFALMLGCRLLGRYWYGKGLLSELDEITED